MCIRDSLYYGGYSLSDSKTMRLYGINAEIWSIAIGMIIANTIGTPKLVKDGA